jgi:flagellar hook-associated protein 2
MAIRVSGLNSGLDTDSIIQELMSAYSAKTEKYEKQQTKLGWKQEAWESLNTKVNSFYKSVGKLKLSSGYSMYKGSTSDTTKASVSVSGTAVVGSQKLHVLSTAQSGYLTGGKLTSTSGSTVTKDTTMSELGFANGSGTFQVATKDDDGNDVTKNINITSSSTISDVVSQLKDAGLNASFDSNNGRIFLSSKTTGTDGDFTLTGTNAGGKSALSLLGLDSSERVTGDTVKTPTGSTATSSSTLGYLGLSGSGKLKVSTTNSKGETTEQYISIDANEDISSVVDKLKLAGLDASFNDSTGKFSLNTTDGGSFTIEAADGEGADADEIAASKANNDTLLSVLGLGQSQITKTQSAVKIDGSDAAISLNGVIYTSSSNNFSINGLTITTSAVTDDLSDQYDSLRDDNGVIDWTKVDVSGLDDSKAVTISTSVDAQGIYDTIKDFLTSYNNIINEITKLYNADSASDYEPLTDDEKDSMSDTEISKWETKIKDSLLRRDTTLNTLMSAMKNAMAQTFEVNGKKYALSSFGIKTLTYGTAADDEENAYHIDGDEDDENTSGNTDKLLAAINDDPQAVVDFMKQLTTKLYTAIDNQMQSSTLRSRYSIYNDKELKSQYSTLTTTISDWEDKVSDKEDYYYSKFASMETALGTLQSQTSSLTGLLGS